MLFTYWKAARYFVSCETQRGRAFGCLPFRRQVPRLAREASEALGLGRETLLQIAKIGSRARTFLEPDKSSYYLDTLPFESIVVSNIRLLRVNCHFSCTCWSRPTARQVVLPPFPSC